MSKTVTVEVAKSLRTMARRGEMLSARDNVVALANTVEYQAQQIANVLALIPQRNPELIEAGYDIDARVILAALGVES